MAARDSRHHRVPGIGAEDLFHDQVFVYTPKGDIMELAAGATPIDFAYKIHTDLGHRISGAKVNGRLVSLDTPLQNGDTVEVVAGKTGRGPIARLVECLARVRGHQQRAAADSVMVQPAGSQRKHQSRPGVAAP